MMSLKTTGEVNEHGRQLIDNEERDYGPYLVKRISPTMRAYHEFLTELYGDLSDLDTDRLVYLAVALHTHFQAGTWWHDRKHDVRPGSLFNDGSKPGPKPPGTPRPVPAEKKPRRESRGKRDAGIAPPY